MPEDHEMRDQCKEKFEQINKRLDDGDEKFKAHDGQLVNTGNEMTELRTNVNNLTKSMDGLTKSIWGAVVAAASLGIGFVIWYLQSLPR